MATKTYAPKVCDKNRRKCVVCGRDYFAFPSASRVSCGSDECRTVAVKRQGRTHGDSGTRLHNIWCGMHTRCRINPLYRHLEVAKEWDDFNRFSEWALANGYSGRLEIDRRDNERGYSPENCRWATRRQQMMNTRARSSKSKSSKYKGVQFVSHCKKQWRAQACVDGRPKQIGLFETEEQAALAYDEWAKCNYGEFASLNFKE